MTVKSFQFIRPADVSGGKIPKGIEINGTAVEMIDQLSSIDLMMFAAGTMESGARALIAVDRLFRTAVVPADYEAFIDKIRELDLTPDQLAELAQGIVEVYTVRPTEPS